MKKLLSIVLCLVMLAALLPYAIAEETESVDITGEDYSDPDNLIDTFSDNEDGEFADESINTAFEGSDTVEGTQLGQDKAYLLNGKYYKCTAVSANGNCWDYAKGMYTLIWPNVNFGTSYRLPSSPNNMLRNLTKNECKLTANNLKAFFSVATYGATVRICPSDKFDTSNEGGSGHPGHSLIFVDRDSNGITFFQDYGSKGPYTTYWTYEDFVKEWGAGTTYNYEYIKYIQWPGSQEYSPNPGAAYLAKCTTYPTFGSVTTNKAVEIWSLPCTSSTSSLSVYQKTLAQGNTYNVFGLYKNTANQYWYKVSTTKEYYLYAGDVTWNGWKYSDIELNNAVNPSQLTQGSSFSIQGTITSTYNIIESLYAYCYSGSATSGTPVISSSAEGIKTRYYSLKGSTLDNNLKFGQLATGSYTYVLRYSCTYYYSANGTKLSTGGTSRVLHSNSFTVGSPKTVTVTFNANGGSVSPSSATVTVGSAYGTLPTPTRTGYRFTGWYTAASGGTQVTASTTVTNTSSHTLYAHWTPYTYTVTLNANGGSVSPTSITVTYDGTYSDLPTPTRTGYDFNGWFTASSGGSQVTTSTKVTTASNHTLYAQWTARQYNVQIEFRVDGIWTQDITEVGSFDLYINGQKWQEDRATSWEYPLSYGSVWEITDIKTKSGKAFTGCTQGSIAGTVTGYQYIELAFATQTVTVTFDANGGTVSPETKTVTVGSAYGELPTPTRGTSYKFRGWYKSDGTKVTEETIVTDLSDHTLTAQYSAQIQTKIQVAVQCVLDGEWSQETTGFGTYDVYLKGECALDNGTYFNQIIEKDNESTYEIKDIRVEDGKSYNGIIEGQSLGGNTLSGRTGPLAYNTMIYLDFTTVHPKEWLSDNAPEEFTYNGHKYLFFSEPVTWYEAKTISEYLGGHLLRIDDSAENTYINNATDQAECWLGAMDETYGEEIYRIFVWTDDGTELSYKNWAAGQPDNDADNDEGSSNFVYITPTGKWATAPGCTKHGFVCEIDQTAIPFNGTIEWNASDVQFKGTTPYVVYNGAAFTPRFTVKDKNGNVVSPSNYTYEYRENRKAGTGYVIVTFTGGYSGTARAWFKIYLPPTTGTKVENVKDGIKISWEPVEGAAGYVVYRRAWSSTTNGWTTFERWNNVTGLEWIDGSDANHKVYAGSRYQYGVKAYFAQRVDPVSGATIGGNVGDNYNLGEVGPLKTTVRITTRVLNSVTAGKKQMTVKWAASSVFTGYQIQYATNSTFTKNAVALKISNPKTAETVIKKLTKGTTYYVRVRSYHEFNGMTYFGEWSNVKSCKVK